MSALVHIVGKKVFTDSLIVSAGINNGIYDNKKHKNTIALVRKHKLRLEKFGQVAFQKRPDYNNSEVEYVELNEDQAARLIMLHRPNDVVLDFQDNLILAFRKAINELTRIRKQRLTIDWQEARANGKAVYHEKSDVIKQFIEYAQKQGSKSSDKYYMCLADMENKALFSFSEKLSNVRDVLNTKQLMQVSTADDLIERALLEGMEKGLNYKDVYRLAKQRVTALTDVIGRSHILALSFDGVTSPG